VASVVRAHSDVSIAKRGGDLVIVGVGHSLDLGCEGCAQTVLGEARADYPISRQLGQEIARLLLKLFGIFLWLTVESNGNLALGGAHLDVGQEGLQLR